MSLWLVSHHGRAPSSAGRSCLHLQHMLSPLNLRLLVPGLPKGAVHSTHAQHHCRGSSISQRFLSACLGLPTPASVYAVPQNISAFTSSVTERLLVPSAVLVCHLPAGRVWGSRPTSGFGPAGSGYLGAPTERCSCLEPRGWRVRAGQLHQSSGI